MCVEGHAIKWAFPKIGRAKGPGGSLDVSEEPFVDIIRSQCGLDTDKYPDTFKEI